LERSTHKGNAVIGEQGPRATGKVRLALAVVVCLACATFLIVRVLRTLSNANSAYLRLADDVALGSPPPTSADQSAVRKALQDVESSHRLASDHPDDPTALLEWGRQAINAGDPLSARAGLSRAVQLVPPHDPTVYDALGTAQSQLGLYREAVQSYRRMVNDAPNDAAGYLGLSRAYSALGDRNEAARAIEQASQSIPPNDVRGRLDVAAEFDARFQSTRALEEAHKAQAAAPNDPGVVVSVAGLLVKLHRNEEAQCMLRAVLARNPTDHLANRLMGQIENDPTRPARNEKMAEHYFLTALRSDPHDAKACGELAQMYLDQRRYKQAAYVALLWLAATPNSGSARMCLANAYAGLRRTEESGQQREIAQRLLAWERKTNALGLQRDRTPTDPRARIALARSYMEGGHLANALVEAQAALCLAPKSQDANKLFRQVYGAIGVQPPDRAALSPTPSSRSSQ
jgi:tetratricopeptide (TPR) repeat protein